MSPINVWNQVRKWGGRLLLGAGAITLTVAALAVGNTWFGWLVYTTISLLLGWFIEFITQPSSYISQEVNN